MFNYYWFFLDKTKVFRMFVEQLLQTAKQTKIITMKILFPSLLALMFVSAIFMSCDKDDETTPQATSPETQMKNIVQLAQENGFYKLAEAATRADLVEALQADATLTVFAPTDEAFDALLENIGHESIQDIPVAVLQQILLYHVVPSKVMSTDISDGNLTSLQGSDLNLNTRNGILVNDLSLQAPYDVEASNGVIHAIDRVLVPAAIAQYASTLLEPAHFNNNFSNLDSEVGKAELDANLLTTPNLTILVPTNNAFTSAGMDDAEIKKETLTPVLTYHVSGEKVISNAIPRFKQFDHK